MRRKNKGGIAKMVLIDIMIALLIIAGWPVSRYVEINSAAKQFEASATPAPAQTEAPIEAEQTQPPVETEAIIEPTPTPQPDNRTEWQKKFEEFFTDEVISTETTYKSPNVSITVTKSTYEANGNQTVYFVADIYIASIDCFRSYFAHNADYPNRTALLPSMAEECGAILAINGDYCGMSFGGIILRNGTMYINQPNASDICILHKNGEMECMKSTAYSQDMFPEGDVMQIWSFGPSLLSSDGKALTDSELDVPYYLAGLNPRTAIGYYEPGHYCFMVADGRQNGYSAGLYMEDIGKIMESLGCKIAYNLDGGGSSMMYLNGEFVNSPSTEGQRDVPDILIIKDIAPTEGGAQ